VKGDALYMMELVLSLEKLNFHKLRLLHDIACKHDDAEMADFIGEPPVHSHDAIVLAVQGGSMPHLGGICTGRRFF
jgi:hypothetical protein